MQRLFFGQIEARTANTGFASGGVLCTLEALCFYSSEVQVESFVLRNPPELLSSSKKQRFICKLKKFTKNYKSI